MDRTVLVVGAAGGVGGGVVELLIGRGYHVIGTVLNEAEAAAVRKASPAIGEIVIMDMADGEGVLRTLAPIMKRPLDLAAAIVCAAISPYGPLETTPLANFRRTLEINTVGDLAVYQACMPQLRKSKGRLILTSSNAGKIAFPFIGHYVASKHALEALGDVMRQEAAAWGVDVILIEPGTINTSMVSNMIAGMKRDLDALTPEVRALYGELHKSFHGLAAGGIDAGMKPITVAHTIMAALKARKPKTRYMVGDDSKLTIRMRRTNSDRKMDAFFADTFASAGFKLPKK